MKLEVKTDLGWSGLRLTLIDEPSSMGDRVRVCLHKENDDPEIGTTTYLYKTDLVRAVKMLAVAHSEDTQ